MTAASAFLDHPVLIPATTAPPCVIGPRMPRCQLGDILAVSSRGIAYSAIKWWTCSQIDHLAFVVDPNTVIDACPKGGVDFRPMTRYTSASWVVLRTKVALTDAQLEKMMAFAVSQRGKGYDWRGIAGFVINRDVNDREKWFCSEYVESVFETGGVILVPRKAPGITSPELPYQSNLLEVADTNNKHLLKLLPPVR